MAFLAPQDNGSNRLETEIVPAGQQLCTLYGIIDLGTQDSGKFGLKRQVQMSFEFPQELRIFTEGGEPRPAAVFTTDTFSMAPKANLKKRIDAMVGRVLTEDDVRTFDMSSLIGQNFVANIVHSPDGKWANISSIMRLDERTMLMFGLQEPNVAQVNDTVTWHTSQGFEHEDFGKLPSFLRDKIRGSVEGKKHEASGGTFAEYVKENGNSTNPGASSNNRILAMNPDAQFTFEQYKAQGWTDQQLVDNGHATWQEPVAAPQPQSAPATPPAQPQAPAATPPAQPAAPAPVATPPAQPAPQAAPAEKKLVMKDPSQDLNQWLSQGWTEELLIEHGHASFQ